MVDLIRRGGTIVKTATTLQALTVVAASVQQKSGELDLSGQSKLAEVSIYHAKDSATASVGQGTEYAIQVSPKASGNDSWIAKATFVAAITAPVVMITDGAETVGATTIECATGVPAIGDIVFFKSATIANSEWANVIARNAASTLETVTLEDGLTNAQAASTYYTQGERFNALVDVTGALRMRAVCNNTKGTTNQPIVWQCLVVEVV